MKRRTHGGGDSAGTVQTPESRPPISARPTEVAATLHDLLALPGVTPVDELPWPAVLALWPRRIEGSTDAALVAVTRAGKHDALATFDDRLRRRLSRLGVSTAW